MSSAETGTASPPEAGGTQDPEGSPASTDSGGDKHLRTDHLQGDLAKRAMRGGALMVTGHSVRLVLRMGSTAILARVLTPDDFGLFAMVVIVSNFLLVYRGGGLIFATVQRQELTRDQVSTLFWINAGISLLLGLLAFGVGPAVSWFYGEPQLAAMLGVLGIGLFLGGLGAQHQALLQRQMRFKHLVIADLMSIAFGVTLAVVIALNDGRHWALVANVVGTAAASTTLLYIFCGWRPGLPKLRCGVLPLLTFGWMFMFSSVLAFVAKNVDNILIGWRWGKTDLGLYNKAYGVLLLPMQQVMVPLGMVAMPALSRTQNDPEQFRRYYCRAVMLTSYVTGPLLVGLAVFAREMILVLMGSQWVAVIPIAKLLAIGTLGMPLVSTLSWVFGPLSQVKRLVCWNLMMMVMITGAVAIGLEWKLKGVAIAYVIVWNLVLLPLGLIYGLRRSPVSLSDVIRTAWRPYVLCVLAFGLMEGGRYLAASNGVPPWIGALVVGCGFGGAMYAIMPALRRDVRDLFSYVRKMRG